MRKTETLFVSPSNSNYMVKITIEKVGDKYHSCYCVELGRGSTTCSAYYHCGDENLHSKKIKARHSALEKIKTTLKWRAEDTMTRKPEGMKELCAWAGFKAVDPHWLIKDSVQSVDKMISKKPTNNHSDNQLLLF